jgi:hypothetical protein
MNWVFGYAAVGMILITFSKVVGHHAFPAVNEVLFSMFFWPIVLVATIKKVRNRK